MRRCARVLTLLVTLGALLGTSRGARAQAVRFSLSYTAPPTCPDRDAWLEQLSRRSSNAALATEDEPAPALQVVLSEVAEGARAEIVITDSDGHESRRTLAAPTCRDAVEASAWICALWLDPANARDPATGQTEAFRAPPPGAPAPEPKPPKDASREQTTKPLDHHAPPPAPSTPSLRFGASVELGTFFTALPQVPLGVAGFVEVSSVNEGLLRPRLRLGIVDAGAGETRTERGSVRVSLVTSRALFCPLAWQRSRFTLTPCAMFELGSLKGRGEQTLNRGEAAVLWRSAGVSARAALELAPAVALEAEAGLVFPLLRDRFVFGPSPVLAGFETPATAGTFSLGILLHE